MSTQITIEGRLVQGGVMLKPAKDMKGQRKLDKEGKPYDECYMGIAVPKLVNGQPNPQINEYYAAFAAEARANFPHLHPNGGACTHPRFADKWQDGDGTNDNGQSVAGKPGFAGHWIISCTTRYAPTCYARDSHGQLVQIPDPEKVIKKGYRVAVGVTISGNGVDANSGQAVPGLFVSPNLVLFVAPDTEISSGPDPTQAFANVQAQTGLVQGVGGLATPPQPGQQAAPAGGPPMPGQAAPAPQGNAPMPGQAAPAAMPSPAAASPAGGSPPMPAGGPPMPGGAPTPPAPTYVPTASAQGATVEGLLALGWTIPNLLAAGHIVQA